MAHAGPVPDAFKEVVDQATYDKSVAYSLAKGNLSKIEDAWDSVVLLAILFSGVLPWAFSKFWVHLGPSAWAMASYLFTIGLALSITGLPLEWYGQFRLEQRFGFNTSTQQTWWLDRLKGFLLALILGYPLLILVLKLVEWTGRWWWFWVWATILVFQLMMAVLAPALIMPLFNKFTPLPEGSLRERLLKLAERTRFRARSIQIMDGSKRSRHSNAFFTGFGRLRKIVLFDTLVQQLTEPELESVLAHEIGHFRKKHIPKMLAASALGSLLGFYIISFLAGQQWFYEAFGFITSKSSGWMPELPDKSIAPALLLFALLSGVVLFWLSPLMHWWSRRYEYQADAFAAAVMNEAASLRSALRKLNEKNLSNLTPHPLYSGFYYSHPTLLERERALAGPRAVGQTFLSAGQRGF